MERVKPARHAASLATSLLNHHNFEIAVGALLLLFVRRSLLLLLQLPSLSYSHQQPPFTMATATAMQNPEEMNTEMEEVEVRRCSVRPCHCTPVESLPESTC